MKQLRLAHSIVKMMIKDRMHYPMRLIVDTLVTVIRCGLLLILYAYIFKSKNNTINGTDFQTNAWSIFMYCAFMTLQIRYLATGIMQDIKSGTIETLIVKPIHYLWYRMWWQLGSGIYAFLLILILGSVVMYVIIGFPAAMSSLFFISTFIVVFLLSSLLSLCIYGIVGLCAFWVEDIKPLHWIIDKSIMMLGGSWIPIALFPPLMYKIAVWSPFGASQFVTHTVYASWKTDYLHLIGIQLFWVLVLGTGIMYMFKQARKKVSINGG